MNREDAKRIELRLLVESDVAYVAKTWVESYRRESTWARGQTDGIYYPAHRKLVNDLLARAPCIVAANPKSPTHIVGFCCAERRSDVLTVHYVSVKYTFRNFGVARALLRSFDYVGDEPVVVTHWTHAARNATRNTRPIVYNPYILFSEYRSFWNDPSAETASARRKGKAEQGERDTTADPALGTGLSSSAARSGVDGAD